MTPSKGSRLDRKPPGKDIRCEKCAAGMYPCPIGECPGHWPSVEGPCDSPTHAAWEGLL